MQALMGKSNKALTPQDLYWEKKRKTEDGRTAFLPPGLVNHGNTCFMNSVLQGLISTPMLADIVRFSLPESYAPVSSRRSPQLTNGHGVGGEVEREWEKGMPLGDTFVQLMQKAWNVQDGKGRQTMSPKDLLQMIGAKFDQYLDFRQQDAHEFLRHLLDAMRMEELDIIKQRQPPPPKSKRKRKGHKDASSSQDIPEEDRLVSFVDMVFGGRLASILVCEKCKKISWTYEDFNDLSLSIKQEDYEKGKKRDRLKTLARKLGMRGRPSTRDLDIPDGPRSSSVPSSPLRRSEEAEKSFELVLGDVGHRRRSLEAGEETPSLVTSFQEEPSLEAAGASNEQATREDKRMLSIPEEQKPPEDVNQQKEGSKREKDEDSWIKLRRKISVSVKKGNKKKTAHKEPVPDLPSNDDSQAEATTGDEALDSYVDVKAPSPMPASPSMSPLLGASIALQKFSFVRRPSSTRTGTNSPGPSIVASPSRSPDIPPVSLPPQETRPSSPSPVPAPPSSEHVRSKSPRPPKPSRTESAYLRRLLADIPSTSSSSSSVPFNLFRSGPTTSSSSPDVSETRGAWPKFGHVQSVEGCLRMFTAVEVLDGENMVKCRRCWKIQHGEYVPREKRGQKDKSDDDEEADDDEEDEDASSNSSISVKINLADSGDLSHVGRQGRSSPLSSSMELSEDISIRSAPPTSASSNSEPLARDNPQGTVYLNSGTSSSPAMPVPAISMTVAESTSPTSGKDHSGEMPSQSTTRIESSVRLSSPSRDSLKLPAPSRHSRQPAERSSRLSLASDTSSVSSDDSGDEAEETETSATASIRSDSSSVASTQLQPPGLSPTTTLSTLATEHTSDALPTNPDEKAKRTKEGGRDKGKGIPRSKQVIMRRAYKRYLIATPPPVLVIHLKRFQQVGRTPTQLQFFANFKKLDDPVSFPEYLNLSPYLLPSKDEVKGKSGKRKKSKEEKEAGSEGCMYRLYAVVVHIGNMLGGHYVAYTALPEAAPPPEPSKDKEKDTSSLSTSSTQTAVETRPEVPRTTSFTRTADPHSHSSFKSRTSSSSKSSGGAQRQWSYVSDTTVRLATLEEVLQAKAYLCMYERI